VFCQLESIRQCVKLRALREALSSLPKTLDETYDRILQGLESTGQLRDTITALRWLCYSKRPLRLSEIVEVLAIENGDDGGFFPEERLPDPADIMVVCSSLISCNVVSDDANDGDGDSTSDLSDNESVQSRANQIQLAHFSVKEYLLSNRCAFRSDFQTQACHRQIAEGCCLCEQAPLTGELVDQYPLAQYVAEHWWQHAQDIEEADGCTVFDLTSRLLTIASGALLSWVQLYNPDKPREDLDLSLTSKDVAQPLYYAAFVGLSKVIENILPQVTNVNARGGWYGNALQAASLGGHEKVVQMLVDAGADVNAQGGYYGNALQAASYDGNEKVVQMLVDAGADVNAQGGEYGNALQKASCDGHERP
jgi:Ankyrin repeats (3 copies)